MTQNWRQSIHFVYPGSASQEFDIGRFLFEQTIARSEPHAQKNAVCPLVSAPKHREND